jgi:hypothetical protein
MNLRLGTKVRVTALLREKYDRVGKIVPMPGGVGRTRNGTAGFKYVQFEDGSISVFFAYTLERV